MSKILRRLLLGLANMAMVIALAAGIAARLGLTFRALPAEWLMGAALVPLYLPGARWIERRNAGELRLADLARGLGVGMLLGAALFSCVMGILWLAGVYQPSGLGSWRPLAGALLSALAGAVLEEMIFRGFLFRMIAGLGGNWTALTVTSALAWRTSAITPPPWQVPSLSPSRRVSYWAPPTLPAGRLAADRDSGWNFAEGSVFGMAVSGHARRAAWVGGELRGPALLTGGAFGPEASTVAVVVCLGAAIIYLRKLVTMSSSGAPPLSE